MFFLLPFFLFFSSDWIVNSNMLVGIADSCWVCWNGCEVPNSCLICGWNLLSGCGLTGGCDLGLNCDWGLGLNCDCGLGLARFIFFWLVKRCGSNINQACAGFIIFCLDGWRWIWFDVICLVLGSVERWSFKW